MVNSDTSTKIAVLISNNPNLASAVCSSPVQILVKYLTDSSNCAFLWVDSSKKNFGPIHGTVFFPQGLKVSALVCVENGLNLVG